MPKRSFIIRELPHLAILVAMFANAAVRWSSAPDEFPAHWNFAGEVDRYGGKFEGLLLIPLITLGLYLLLLAIPRIDPARQNYRHFELVYSSIRLVLTGFMGVLYVLILLSAAGRQVDMNLVLGLLAGGMIFVLGTVMGRIKPNYMVGVRTPWTLASQAAWASTHRVTGWLFMAAGALTIVVTLISGTAGIFALMGTVIGGTVIAVVYSYWAYAHDDERIPVMGVPRRVNTEDEES